MSKKWYRIPQLIVPLSDSEESLSEVIGRSLGLGKDVIQNIKIIRKSLDARGRREPRYNYSLEVFLNEDVRNSVVSKSSSRARTIDLEEVKRTYTSTRLNLGSRQLNSRPVIVGLGPAGLFAALRLAEYGFNPLILERGDGLHSRVEKIEKFWETGLLDPESNLQFGSGGAGTFSDGKLVTRIRNPHLSYVLSTMVELGAPEEIGYWHKPHVGTDRLRTVVEALQNRIVAAGGELKFRTRVKRPVIRDGQVVGVELTGGEEIRADVLILATGHSARSIYEELYRMGIPMEVKPLAIGLRVEHPQELIDRAQYGRWAGDPRLGAADYRLTYHHSSTGRGVYSFCMCPGGLVVAAASEESGVVTNGMSNYARNTGIANAALVVTVGPKDFGARNGHEGILAGIEFQRSWERAAYRLGGGEYKAPVQTVEDFLNNESTKKFKSRALIPTYRPGFTPNNLHNCLPSFVTGPLADGIRYFNRLIPGFGGPDAILTGVETRTSAPVRILRNEEYESPGVEGFYPCGEGSGYAGGITSSAIDGVEVANRVIMKYKPHRSAWF